MISENTRMIRVLAERTENLLEVSEKMAEWVTVLDAKIMKLSDEIACLDITTVKISEEYPQEPALKANME